MNYIKSGILSDRTSENYFRSSFGHSMYNYITGLLLSKKLNMKFIHSDLTNSTSRFNSLLNLKSVFDIHITESLDETHHINPYEHENIKIDYETISGIDSLHNIDYKKTIKYIESLVNDKNKLFIIGSSEGTHFPGLLIDSSEWIIEPFQKAYWSKNSKKNTIYKPDRVNVAIHVRRGDIKILKHPDRWRDNFFYISLISKIKSQLPNAKFYLFSEGDKSEFSELSEMMSLEKDVYSFGMEPLDTNNIKGKFDGEVNLILGGRDTEIFHHLVSSDVLVTGQSTFSTISAYFTKGKVIYVPCMNYAKFDNFTSDRFINVNEINKLK